MRRARLMPRRIVDKSSQKLSSWPQLSSFASANVESDWDGSRRVRGRAWLTGSDPRYGRVISSFPRRAQDVPDSVALRRKMARLKHGSTLLPSIGIVPSLIKEMHP